MTDKKKFMLEAIKCSQYGMDNNAGGPFGAVIVKDGEIVARGWNKVTSTNDPTAHAEVTVIREACKILNTFDLTGCDLYTSCEPCPMCLSATYWAGIKKVYYGNTRKDAADINFDDDFIYSEISLPIEKRSVKMEQVEREEAQKAFQNWLKKRDRTEY
jgi:tRNA(Arg) A34 adenosine deaminase TadA